MSLTVRSMPDGTFAVVDGNEIVSGGHQSHSAAWRAADRLEDEAVSPIEKRADYAFRNSLPTLASRPRETKPVASHKRKSVKHKKRAERRRRPAKIVDTGPTRDYRLGTFGAASPVRKISVEAYLREKDGK